MSEKGALQLEEGMQSPVEPPTSPSPHKARRRARLYKAACFYFSLVMANNMHKYAVANTPQAQQTRWNELIAPVNAHLSPWILLFSAPLPGPSRPSFLDTTTFFIAAIFSYIVYARIYYQWNQQNDRYQLPILVVAALAGLITALSLNIGFLISVFCVTPKAALIGLLVSDTLHLAYQGPWQQQEVKEHPVDVEKGLQSNVDASDNLEEDLTIAVSDTQSDADAHRQAAIAWHRRMEEQPKEPLLPAWENSIRSISTNCEETHQASRYTSCGETESCGCLAQIQLLQANIANFHRECRREPDVDCLVRGYEQSQNFNAQLANALKEMVGAPVASSSGQPPQDKPTHPECEQPKAKEHTVDVEKGLQSTVDTRENAHTGKPVIVAEEDTQSDVDAHREAAIAWYREREERTNELQLEMGLGCPETSTLPEHLVEIWSWAMSHRDAPSSGKPRLDKTTHPECEQPCCWGLGSSSGASENA